MRLLKRERDVLDELLPGLDSALAAMSLRELELPENPGLKAFTAHGGPGLLVPAEHAGISADAVAAVRVQRALAAQSPSLAVATTIHRFSVATLVETCSGSVGFEWMLLEGISRDIAERANPSAKQCWELTTMRRTDHGYRHRCGDRGYGVSTARRCQQP